MQNKVFLGCFKNLTRKFKDIISDKINNFLIINIFVYYKKLSLKQFLRQQKMVERHFPKI